MRPSRLNDRQHQRLTVALWWFVAYLLIVYISLKFGHRAAAKPGIAD